MTGQPLTTSATAPKSRIGKALTATLAGYALTLLLKNDSVWLLGALGIFVMVGGYIVLALATYPKASGRGASEEGTPDMAAAVRAHYSAIARWGGIQLLIAAACVAADYVLGSSYLWPLTLLSAFVLLLVASSLIGGIAGTRRCARAGSVYEPVSRPFKPFNIQANGKSSLRLGDAGAGESPIMAGTDPLRHHGWPSGHADWVWFAGDDAFGGTVMLPHSGMLIFVQPKDPDEAAGARKAADPERTQRAIRAGLLRRDKM
ncbi:hypothetical protein [Streptomyces endophyticus]|uniref:Uncharacterized protein n=1 Tax=Streptomyces endophyticus TaxID=714166 RepID=A0ABU6FF78_9ACTN|nr:hypothetical protein [Streptomyces endophyticus]MEB8342682.1 hypothetical protein [Streptomyces endophyticus]